MTDRPIIFSAPMVRALLEGRKTQTRRLVRGVPEAPSIDNVRLTHRPQDDQPYLDAYCGAPKTAANPRGMSDRWCWWTRDDRPGPLFRVGYTLGDRLWVREAWRAECTFDEIAPADLPRTTGLWWEATRNSERFLGAKPGRRRSSMHMPRWASRLTLTVTDIRVQRLQDISEEDAIAESVQRAPGGWWSGAEGQAGATPRGAYAVLWNSLHGHGSWQANPWIAAVSFTVEQRNIDAKAAAA